MYVMFTFGPYLQDIAYIYICKYFKIFKRPQILNTSNPKCIAYVTHNPYWAVRIGAKNNFAILGAIQ